MNTNKVMLATLVATAVAMAFAVMPALTLQASAVPAEKRVVTKECSEEKFEKFDGCPGKSEDSQGVAGETRDEETICTARNPGQAKDCPEGSTIVLVNP